MTEVVCEAVRLIVQSCDGEKVMVMDAVCDAVELIVELWLSVCVID